MDQRRAEPSCIYFLFLGKRADTVKQILQDMFEQAVWRQPSMVLLDDLDHLTRGATSPEHEHGPEALLQQHIAQSKLRNSLIPYKV